MNRHPKRKFNWWRTLLNTLLVLFLTQLLLEWIYREQWIDFYKHEWRYQNKVTEPDTSKTRILVFGDSFSADQLSWVNLWKKDTLKQVFNAAIPGTGPETFRLIAGNRIKEVKPDIVLVQLYEGNDLYDLSKPVRWKVHGIGRNLFWFLSSWFRSLGYINYRLGQHQADLAVQGNPKESEQFDPRLYDPRTKLFIKGDLHYPQTHIQLTGDAEDTFEKMLVMLREIREASGNQVRFIVIPVPHCIQVHGTWLRNYRKLGAKADRSVLKDHIWAEKLRKAGFEVIDPLGDFRKAAQKGQVLYYPNDPHLNAEGQQLLLNCIKNRLEK